MSESVLDFLPRWYVQVFDVKRLFLLSVCCKATASSIVDITFFLLS
ncbi:MAG: hypothetical protein Q8P67_06280 [archaeon]|nr:hypothetical protein [archaeon]